MKAIHDTLALQAYFIAHAPAEPQPWFQPAMPPRPPCNGYASDDGQRFYDTWIEAEKHEGEHYMRLGQDEAAQWDIERAKQRYVQWPLAWADEQIKLLTLQKGAGSDGVAP